MVDGKIPQNAAEFLEAAAKIFFEAYSTGVWKDYEANQAQNKARNVVSKVFALPGAEHIHGYKKTNGDFGILRDETGEDIDVAFAVGRFTFMVACSELYVRMAEAEDGNWKRVKDVPVSHVESFLSIAMDGKFTADDPHNMAPLELTAEMEIHPDPVAAQMEGEDIFVFEAVGPKDALVSIPLGQLTEIRSIVNEAIGKYDGALEWSVRTDREHATFNINGYSMARGEGGDPTILISGPEGSIMSIKTKSLTDFLDRRLNPNTQPLDPDHGN